MNYKNSVVRHLAWCLLSEPLHVIPNVTPLVIKPSQTLQDWLGQLDDQPEPLHNYISGQNSTLLGSYFECLWQFFFAHYPDWTLLGHHIQIQQDKQTLGELDILAQETANRHNFHVELAVKFYLKTPHTSGEKQAHWLGPQSRDRLDLKLEKLTKKQLPFFHHDATQHELKSRHLPTDAKQALVLKGYLFEPFKQNHIADQATPFPSINSGTQTHHWLHYKDSQALFLDDKQWVILPKHQWLGPYQHTKDCDLTVLNTAQAKQQVDDHFNHAVFPFALMLVMLCGTQQLKERTRYMLVHDDWPKQANKRPTRENQAD